MIGVGLGLLGSVAWAQAPSSSLSGKTLIVGIHNRAPWGYRDAKGDVVGFHPDVIRAALAPLGVKLEFTVADFGALIPGLLADRLDAVASGVAITPARCKQVIFGEPDLAAGDGLLVPAGNPANLHSYADIVKNPKIRLGGDRGTENVKNALAAGVPEAQMLLFPNSEATVSALLAGRIDAITISAPTVASLIDSGALNGIDRALPFTGYIKPDGQPAMMETAVVFRTEDAALRDAYDAQLARLKADGTLQQIMAKYHFSAAETAPPTITTADICAGRG